MKNFKNEHDPLWIPFIYNTFCYIVRSTNTTFLYCTQPLINHIDYLNWHQKHDHVVWNPSINLSFCLGIWTMIWNIFLFHSIVTLFVNKTYLLNCLHPPPSLPTSSFLFLNELCYYWHFVKPFLISFITSKNDGRSRFTN